MTLTVRLDLELEAQLAEQCRREGSSKSEIVTRALREYIEKHRASLTPYELALDLIEGEDDGDSTASETYKRRVREQVVRKHSR